GFTPSVVRIHSYPSLSQSHSGSLFAVDVMLQDPVGRVVLRRDKEETEIKLDPPENLYVHSIRHFNQAVLTGSQVLETRPNLLRCRRSMFPPAGTRNLGDVQKCRFAWM